ncbi:MAG: protein-L-isoaspartate O-methyltransferase [Burkholderiales bacterium]|jgi:protein-L-isoaspartate(D-aspartate) O-methyltransferase|nr:protein-L-isoaspartate O-methyltransferase [Burkholderiales bacterium]
MDFNKARFNMVEQQIRPWNVLDQSILDLLFSIKRENFVAPELREMAFSDLELPIRIDGKNTGEVMLSPKMEARMVQELALKAHDHVLEIGTGSGYMTALLASKSESVTSVEIRPEISAFAKNNLKQAGIANVNLVVADGACGYAAGGNFDAIVITGAVPVLSANFKNQLKVGGRLLAVVGEEPVQSAVLITRMGDKEFSERKLFEVLIPELANAPQPERFHF